MDLLVLMDVVMVEPSRQKQVIEAENDKIKVEMSVNYRCVLPLMLD